MSQTENLLTSSATLAAVESVADEDVPVSDESSSLQISAPLELSEADKKDIKIAIISNESNHLLLAKKQFFENDSKPLLETESTEEVTESESDLNGGDITGKVKTTKGIQV
jgi:hypothetical protein